MNNRVKRFISLAFTITFAMPHVAQCTEEQVQEDQSYKILGFQSLPEEKIKLTVLKYAAIGSVGDGTIAKLPTVCKEWQFLIKNHKIEIFKFAICQVYSVDPENCERFLNGKLIYKPHPYNDNGRIELRILDLGNPLEGTFDLSQFGNNSEGLSISTGYRKGKNQENTNKLEIWLVPRFVVKKHIHESAKHFSQIFSNNWPNTVLIGIFWTKGQWDNLGLYDYLTSQSMEQLTNLYEKHSEATHHTHSSIMDISAYEVRESLRLYVQFVK